MARWRGISRELALRMTREMRGWRLSFWSRSMWPRYVHYAFVSAPLAEVYLQLGETSAPTALHELVVIVENGSSDSDSFRDYLSGFGAVQDFLCTESSMHSLVMTQGRFWPMRWHRSALCHSAAGFHQLGCM